jgi:polar amino acid transport system substrate-binding protein
MILLSLLASNITARELKVVVLPWPPYASNELPENGLATKIVVEALRRAGYASNLRYEMWERVLKGSKVGYYDIVATVWKTPERSKDFLFSDPYLHNKVVFASTLDNKITYNSLDNLHGLYVGTIKDYAYDEAFLNDPKIFKVEAYSLVQNVRKLLDGKLDLIVADQYVIEYEMNKYLKSEIDKLYFSNKALNKRGLRIAISKRHDQAHTIIHKFNETVKAMKKDGTMDTIINSYGFSN